MDNFSKHIAPLQRQYSLLPPIHNIGYMHHKTSWVDFSFNTANFSFILSGHGEYTCPDGTWEVVAPCVLTQWPDVNFYYGPYSAWEEFYICFPGQSYKQFISTGLMKTNRRLWPIGNFRQFMVSLREFKNLLNEEQALGWSDQLDLAAQKIILQSLIGKPELLDEKERIIHSIRSNIEMNYLDEYDFDELALDANMSPSSFRRYWQKAVGMPPHKYVILLRVGRAQRYLAETHLPISQIALKVGFEDQFYFARKFRQLTGVTPSEYRKNNKIPDGL